MLQPQILLNDWGETRSIAKKTQITTAEKRSSDKRTFSGRHGMPAPEKASHLATILTTAWLCVLAAAPCHGAPKVPPEVIQTVTYDVAEFLQPARPDDQPNPKILPNHRWRRGFEMPSRSFGSLSS
jgi:hypothetical protein